MEVDVGRFPIAIDRNFHIELCYQNNVFLLCLFGVPISWLYIEATRLGFIAFDELIWPARLIGFGLGILSFAVCANIYLGEGLTTKTIISLVLATILVCIQVFWK